MLCATNAALVPYNKQKLRNLEQPIAIISAVNKPPSLAKLASPKHAYGLLNNIMVCKGSKVGIEFDCSFFPFRWYIFQMISINYNNYVYYNNNIIIMHYFIPGGFKNQPLERGRFN